MCTLWGAAVVIAVSIVEEKSWSPTPRHVGVERCAVDLRKHPEAVLSLFCLSSVFSIHTKFSFLSSVRAM